MLEASVSFLVVPMSVRLKRKDRKKSVDGHKYKMTQVESIKLVLVVAYMLLRVEGIYFFTTRELLRGG